MVIVEIFFSIVFSLGLYIFLALLAGGISVCLISVLAPNYKYDFEVGLCIALVIMSGLFWNESEKAAELSETVENLEVEFEAETSRIEEDLNNQIYSLEEQQSFLEGSLEFSFSSFWSPEEFEEIILTAPREEILSMYEMMYENAEYYYDAWDRY